VLKALENIQLRKEVLDFRQNEEFSDVAVVRNFHKMPILSTGGYNDHFLGFIGACFRADILKLHDHVRFIVTALDYLNRYTNDCFFHVTGEQPGKINATGKLEDKKFNKHYFSMKDDLYPYLLVNMRSGSTFTKVTGPRKCERVMGSTIGVATYWGIMRSLNCYTCPTEAINDAALGDSSKIDMNVGDIYGGDYGKLGL